MLSRRRGRRMSGMGMIHRCLGLRIGSVKRMWAWFEWENGLVNDLERAILNVNWNLENRG